MEYPDYGDMSAKQLETQLAKALARLFSKGKAWAKAKADYEAIEDAKKPEIATLMSESEEKSNAAKETEALASGKYALFRAGLNAAREKFYEAQFHWEYAKTKIEVLRTIMSNRREEVRKFVA